MATASKADIRRAMRDARRNLADRAERSLAICAHLCAVEAVVDAQHVMLYDAIPGEPAIEPFASWCRSEGKEVSVPDSLVDPSWPDTVIVPGLAFTRNGARLGQGGGWYDHFLAGRRSDCITIGVGFDVQLLDELPVEAHDVVLDCVVTESGVHHST